MVVLHDKRKQINNPYFRKYLAEVFQVLRPETRERRLVHLQVTHEL